MEDRITEEKIDLAFDAYQTRANGASWDEVAEVSELTDFDGALSAYELVENVSNDQGWPFPVVIGEDLDMFERPHLMTRDQKCQFMYDSRIGGVPWSTCRGDWYYDNQTARRAVRIWCEENGLDWPIVPVLS